MDRYEETVVDQPLDPIPLVARLAKSGLFDQYVVYERDQEWIFAGGALGVVALDGDRVRTRWLGSTENVAAWSGSPAQVLSDALAETQTVGWRAYGWVAFDFAAHRRPTRTTDVAETSDPLARLMIPRTEVRINERGASIRGVDPAESDAVRKLLLAPASPNLWDPTPVEVRVDDTGYRRRVATAVAEIQRGDYQKVVLSRRVRVPFEVDTVATYELGRQANTPARSFLLSLDGLRATGFSPEVIVSVDALGRVSTEPLAGTRAFGLGAEADTRARADLERDPKEVFEHAVSVRTADREARSVCRPGSVVISDFMSVRERGSVQHLGSTVRGELADRRTPWDALEALFPAVTASGIPKPESMDAIFRLEEGPRGLYAGAVLTVAEDGSFDAALVLRTLYEERGQAWLRAGAGVVAQSTPEREFEETCEKLGSVAPFVVRHEATDIPVSGGRDHAARQAEATR